MWQSQTRKCATASTYFGASEEFEEKPPGNPLVAKLLLACVWPEARHRQSTVNDDLLGCYTTSGDTRSRQFSGYRRPYLTPFRIAVILVEIRLFTTIMWNPAQWYLLVNRDESSDMGAPHWGKHSARRQGDRVPRLTITELHGIDS